MKRKIYITGAIIILASAGLFTACKKDNNSDEVLAGNEFWDNGQYLQYQLHGKVKSIKETNNRYPDEYDLLEYDAKGNLLKNFSHKPTRFIGDTYSYDSQDRLTKIVSSSDEDAEIEITEIGYDGQHDKYIPTNFLLNNVRLQRGVTSFRYRHGDNSPITANLRSVEGDRLVFKADLGDNNSYIREFGSQELTITADFKGNLPAKVEIVSTDNRTTEMEVTYFPNGMPSKIVYKAIYGEVTEAVFKANAGFMTLESEKITRDGKTTTHTYQYNDKGFCILEQRNNINRDRYEYEYDSAGNWTEQVNEEFSGNEWAYYITNTREYTYW